MTGIVSERDHIQADIERWRLEMAAIEAEILGGNLDLEGLCLALADWSGELRLLQGGNKARDVAVRRQCAVCWPGLAL